MMSDDGVKIQMKMVPLTDEVAASHLAKHLAAGRTVFMTETSRGNRSHLRVKKDATGYFVRRGRNGSCKDYLGRCKLTYLDGALALVQFTSKSADQFEADQRRRWDEKYGVEV